MRRNLARAARFAVLLVAALGASVLLVLTGGRPASAADGSSPPFTVSDLPVHAALWH